MIESESDEATRFFIYFSVGNLESHFIGKKSVFFFFYYFSLQLNCDEEEMALFGTQKL